MEFSRRGRGHLHARRRHPGASLSARAPSMAAPRRESRRFSGYGVRSSRPIDLERATNPFLRCPDPAAFIVLKRNWPTVKQRLGLK